MTTTDAWPKHADGSNKKVGEMTSEEKQRVFQAAIVRTQAWFDRPEVKAGLVAALTPRRTDP